LRGLDARESAFLCVRFALEKKAYDLCVLDVSSFTSLADFFVICSGRSDTQVQAIAQSIEENLARFGLRPLGIEGFARAHWVVMDYGDVIVHIFFEPVREYYDVERLWNHAPRLALPEPYRTQARQLTLARTAETAHSG